MGDKTQLDRIIELEDKVRLLEGWVKVLEKLSKVESKLDTIERFATIEPMPKRGNPNWIKRGSK